MKTKELKGGKMENRYVLGIVALSIVVLLGVSIVSAFGFGKGFMDADLSDAEKVEMQEQMQEMRTAVENEDYETWKSLMEEKIDKMKEQLTEENFNELVERDKKMTEMREVMEEARETGDFSEVQELREELGAEGLRRGFGGRMKFGRCPKLVE